MPSWNKEESKLVKYLLSNSNKCCREKQRQGRVGECLARGHHFKEGAKNAQRRRHLNDLALKKVKLKKKCPEWDGDENTGFCWKTSAPASGWRAEAGARALVWPSCSSQEMPGFPCTALLLLGWNRGGTILLITAVPKPSSPCSLGPSALNIKS